MTQECWDSRPGGRGVPRQGWKPSAPRVEEAQGWFNGRALGILVFVGTVLLYDIVDILDEEIVRLETMHDATRDNRARREADFAIGRMEQIKATLSIRKKVSCRENER